MATLNLVQSAIVRLLAKAQGTSETHAPSVLLAIAQGTSGYFGFAQYRLLAPGSGI